MRIFVFHLDSGMRDQGVEEWRTKVDFGVGGPLTCLYNVYIMFFILLEDNGRPGLID